MADVDELLDDLEGEDDEETSPTAARQDSSVLNQLRKQLRDEKKSRKAAEERAEANESFRDKYLTSQAPKVLEEAGVDPSLFKLFVKDNASADLTKELAQNWATENGISITEPSPEAQQTTAAEGTFAPTVGGDAPGPQGIPVSQVDALTKAGDFQGAAKLLASGRVVYDHPEAVAQAAGR